MIIDTPYFLNYILMMNVASKEAKLNISIETHLYSGKINFNINVYCFIIFVKISSYSHH